MEDIITIIKPTTGSGLELKPCPFCGCEEIVYMQYRHIAGLRWKVFCCGCSAGIDNGYSQEKHQIQAVWNKRIGG